MSQTATHTPGPWRYQGNGKNRFNVVHDWQRGGIGESIAQQILRVDDAKLMAAAPDMAEALRFALPAIKACAEEYPHGEWPTMLEKARAALAKAGV